MATSTPRERKQRAQHTENKVKHELKGVQRELKDAAHSPLLKQFIRFGYIARGLLFAVIGLLALNIALGRPSAESPDQSGALAIVLGQPFGRLLLTLLLIGLIGFSLWGFIRAFMDPRHRGDDTGALAERFGYLVSGVSYGALIYPTFQMLQGTGRPDNQTEATRDITARLLSNPLGVPVLIAIGALVIVWSIAQLRSALSRDFERDFRFQKMSELEERFAHHIGQIGVGSRAFVFTLIGMFLIKAAVEHDPNQAKGLDAALLSLVEWPAGPLLLALVAGGLILFGIYSMLCARWLKTV